jgi:MATE family multidrug resistance protein
MAVVDVAMAGHASANDLAGVSLGVSIWNMVIITIMGIMMSVSPLVAHYVGARDFHRVPHLVRQGLWKALGVGVIAFVLSNLAAQVFDFMSLDTVVRDLASDFVFITSFALPAFACYRVLYGYCTSINQTKPIMVIALGALALNAFINWLLVFGNWGFPRMGGLGCAWATLLCVWFNLLGLLWWMRSSQVAAHQIALNFTSLVFMVPLSLGVALLTRVGQSLGAGDPVVARFRAWVGVGAALCFAVVSAAGMAVFNQQIANAYTTDAAVAAVAAHLLFLAAIFQLSDATQVVTSCAIRGYKVTRSPMVVHLTAFWVFSLPLGYALGIAPDWLPWRPAQPLAAQGFWIALVVGLTVAALGLVVLLRQITRRHLPVATPHPVRA